MLFSQNKTRVDIYVHKDGGGINGELPTGAKEIDAEESAGGGNGVNKTLWGGTTQAHKKRVIKIGVTHTLATAKQLANNYMSYKVAGVSYRYGDQALQQNVERQVEVFKDVGNTLTAGIMGITYGAWGGAIGMVTGAVLGTASSLINVSFKYREREREYDFKVFKEESGIEYKRARANISLTTGRLR